MKDLGEKMKAVIPQYYQAFRCKAGQCQHSCCIGWEIDIDAESLSYYDSLEGDFAARLQASVSREGTPHFCLQEGDRCPFLNRDGLCDMILALGETALCDICAMHPRFCNEFPDRLELGLGLCCEAAAELILHDPRPFSLVDAESGEAVNDEAADDLTALRWELIELMQDRTHTLAERHEAILARVGAALPTRTLSEWCAFYLDLERLDEAWGECLEELKAMPAAELLPFDAATALAGEQLTVYFLYRYLASAESMEQVCTLTAFAVHGTQLILALHSAGNRKLPLFEYARMYSAEIEYSDVNLSLLCEELK